MVKWGERVVKWGRREWGEVGEERVVKLGRREW